MGGTDQSAILELGSDDAHEALTLSTEAHWNQNEPDWRLFLTQGTVFGMRDTSNALIATAALLPFGDRNAWISMVLVTASWQRRGLATRLLNACLDRAAQGNLTTWLDATPAGATVYGPLGFAPFCDLHRLSLKAPAATGQASPSPAQGSLDDLIARDRHAIGFDRSALLGALADRNNSRIVTLGDAIALVRDGRKARHIGPLLADGAASAANLISAIAQRETAPLLIDVINDRRGLMDTLIAAGWTAERPFLRMRLGTPDVKPAEPAFAAAGPEYG